MVRIVFAALALTTIFEAKAMEIYDEFNGNNDDIYAQPRVPTPEYLNDALFKIVASFSDHPMDEESWDLFETINSLIEKVNLSQNHIAMPVAASPSEDDSKDDSD